MCTPRREKSVLPPDMDEEALDSSPLLLLRPTERCCVGDGAGASISTMASRRLSAPPSVGTLGRRECRAASPRARGCPWGCSALVRPGVSACAADATSEERALAWKDCWDE